MTSALQQEQNQKDFLWQQNLTKGTLAEAICMRHFSAAGWSVSRTGIEHIIPGFAKRDRWQDKNNASQIQKYIGNLPDLLVLRPDSEHDHHYMVEVKFRKNIKTHADLDQFVVKMLWQYRHLLFGDYEKSLFKSITPEEWDKPVDDEDFEFSETLRNFQKNLQKYAGGKDSGIPKLPLLFYIVTPSVHSGLHVHLACLDFSSDAGFAIRSLHDASCKTKEDHSDENIGRIVTGLRGAWESCIQPALGHMFPAMLSAVDKKAFATVLHHCVERVIGKAANRKGAYIKDILDDDEYWKELSSLVIKELKSYDAILDILRQYDIDLKFFEENREGKNYYVELSSL